MKVAVIGETCVDAYCYGTATRLSPDAPVPVLIPKKTTKSAGMASNVAMNLENLGAEVDIITNINCMTKTRYVDDKTNHMFMRVDVGDDQVVPWNKYPKEFNKYDAVIISDYCKGFLSEDDIEMICKAHPRVFLDTKKIISNYCKDAFIIKINEIEWEASRDSYPEDMESKLIITLGKNGCEHQGKNYPVKDVPVKDQTGAGDTFIAGLCYSYLKYKNIDLAITFANECAGSVVTGRGVTLIEKDKVL